MNKSVELARKVFGFRDSFRVVDENYMPDEEDMGLKPVQIDITLISNDLYDRLLREFHKQHGYGIYIKWNITAVKGDTDER